MAHAPGEVRQVSGADLASDYWFTDGQIPPKYVHLWFERNPYEIEAPHHVAVVRGEGPLSEEQYTMTLAAHGNAPLEELAERREAQEGVGVYYQTSMPENPDRSQELAIAHSAACHIFSVARTINL